MTPNFLYLRCKMRLVRALCGGLMLWSVMGHPAEGTRKVGRRPAKFTDMNTGNWISDSTQMTHNPVLETFILRYV